MKVLQWLWLWIFEEERGESFDGWTTLAPKMLISHAISPRSSLHSNCHQRLTKRCSTSSLATIHQVDPSPFQSERSYATLHGEYHPRLGQYYVLTVELRPKLVPSDYPSADATIGLNVLSSWAMEREVPRVSEQSSYHRLMQIGRMMDKSNLA